MTAFDFCLKLNETKSNSNTINKIWKEVITTQETVRFTIAIVRDKLFTRKSCFFATKYFKCVLISGFSGSFRLY